MPRHLSFAALGAALALLAVPPAAPAIPAPPFHWGTLAFAPDGSILASGIGDAIELWDTRTRKLLRKLPVAPDGVTAVAFAPDGRLFLANDNSGVIVWIAPMSL